MQGIGSIQFWREQLEGMQRLGKKAEIEALNAVSLAGQDPLSFLSGTYLHDKLCRHDYWQVR
jgi:DNA topoisomerase VI subunit A